MKKNIANMSHDELLDYYYEKLEDAQKYKFLLGLLEQYPDFDIDLVEMLENTPEYKVKNMTALENFANKFFALHPQRYGKKYEFLEKVLIDHAFIHNDIVLIRKRLEVLKYNPAKGIDTVVQHTLFKLIFHGFYDDALAFSKAVWKPLSVAEDLVGYPEYAFVLCIYLDGLEKQYELIKNGNTSQREGFLNDIKTLGFDNEKKRIDLIFEALSSDIQNKTVYPQMLKKDDYFLLPLNIQFLKYMKKNYGLPFMLSDQFFNILQKKELFGKNKNEYAFFYIDFNSLDKHIIQRYDSFLGSNLIEIFGKTWGLHFVYEFFNHYELINHEYYSLMLENIAHLKIDFMKAASTDLCNLNFVNSFPETESQLFGFASNAFMNIDNESYKNALKQIET